MIRIQGIMGCLSVSARATNPLTVREPDPATPPRTPVSAGKVELHGGEARSTRFSWRFEYASEAEVDDRRSTFPARQGPVFGTLTREHCDILRTHAVKKFDTQTGARYGPRPTAGLPQSLD